MNIPTRVYILAIFLQKHHVLINGMFKQTSRKEHWPMVMNDGNFHQPWFAKFAF
jgi:hypothetical protein